MLKMILRRLVGAIPNIIGVIIVTFLLTRALPGDPAAYFAGPSATTEAIEQIRKQLGLDKSLAHQFVLYVKELARGDLVFWRGHVGLMRDARTLIHANAHHMMVASEPLREARDRILAKSFGAITTIRRLAFNS